jgi:hypothetical protein
VLGSLRPSLLALLAAFLVVAGCSPSPGAGGATPAGNTMTGTLDDAQSLTGQEIVRLTLRTEEGLVPFDVEDPEFANGGLTAPEIRSRVRKQVTIEFREENGRRIALQVTDPAP